MIGCLTNKGVKKRVFVRDKARGKRFRKPERCGIAEISKKRVRERKKEKRAYAYKGKTLQQELQ